MAFDLDLPGGQRRARIIERLNAASAVVETACGPVEFARRGGAPYVLIVHGTPQGHNASFMGAPFEAAGFGTITPSRPGYLRTPLSSGRTFEQQADAFAALLDALAIDAVAVYAVSGGGPSGIQFAARHPERVKALILEVAISQNYRAPVSALGMALFTNPIANWLQSRVMDYLPRLAIGQVLKIESSLNPADRARVADEILADPEKLAVLRRVIADAPPFDLLRSGFENDLKQFASIERLPLEAVRCPTLVVHGTHDGDVPFSHAENSAQGIPSAELHRVEKGWHLLAMSDDGEAVARAEVDFARRHFARS